jgi:hypothetical protein
VEGEEELGNNAHVNTALAIFNSTDKEIFRMFTINATLSISSPPPFERNKKK